MARYIDADKLPKNRGDLDTGFSGIMPIEFVYTEDIDKAPTADVVPKSEVERLQCQVNLLKKYDEERDIALHARLIAKAKAEVVMEIEKIEKRLRKRQNECDKEAKKAGWYLEVCKEYEGESEGIEFCLNELAKLKKKYAGGGVTDE